MTRKKPTRAIICKDTRNRSLILKQQRLRDQKSAVLWTLLHDYRNKLFSHDELRYKLRVLAYGVHGFVSSELRRQIWPILLAQDDMSPKNRHRKDQSHRDEDQLQKDIDRSLWNYTSMKLMKARERNRKRRNLQRIILAVLQGDPDLYYYQGFHDVAAVFYMVLDDDAMAFRLLQKVTTTYFRPCMRSNFDSMLRIVRLLFVIIELQDDDLYQYLNQSKVKPYFAFAWFITWFAHHVGGLEDASRLFDVFLCSHPLFCLYICAAIVLASREKIFKKECEFGVMHDTLSKLVNDVKWDESIVDGLLLMKRFPPDVLLQRAVDQDILISSRYFYDQYPNVKVDLPISQYIGTRRFGHHRVNNRARNLDPLVGMKERPLVPAIIISGAVLVFSYAISVYLYA